MPDVRGDEVTLCVVGPFAVCRDGTILAASDVGSRKARLLLALLALERPSLVPLDRVVDTLWGNTPPRRPAQNVASLVSRLRARFGRDVVIGDRSGYRLGPRIRVDLHDAAGLVAAAEAEPDSDLALSAARLAMVILAAGGVLDTEVDGSWVQPARHLRVALLRRARHTAAEAALRAGDVRAARDAAEAAMAADGFDEAACRMLMRAYYANGEPARALMAYQRLRATLAAELGIDPAVTTHDLHLTILRGTPTRD